MTGMYDNNCLNVDILHSKKDFQKVMLEIINPLKSFYSAGCAELHLGETFAHYDAQATYMEAVSRPLWALVPFWMGGGEETGVRTFKEIYKKALTSGTNPESDEYWGECTSFDQRFVEMAAISYGIMYCPEVVWNPLNDAEKNNLVSYLRQINNHPLPVCNWILFAVMVNIGLKSVGQEYDVQMIDKYLDGLETFYLGEGWYCDGDSGQKDYYISFAIHFYSLIYSDVMKEDDPARCKIYRERALAFAKQFIYWFDEEGDAVPFGRSLTYRFAQVSFFSICLLVGLEPFPIPVMKGLISRHIKSWMDKPIFDRDGILTIGYGYPNLTMAERYNAPGSPYWGMKTFAFLGLPDDHPFWSVEAEPYPEKIINQPVCSMKYADMLAYHYGNHATVFAPGVYSKFGHGNIVEKYGKFAYDTKFSVSVAHSQYELEECAPDNMLAFVIHDYVYVRRQCISSKIMADSVVSVWSPYPGITVETTVTPYESGHVRTHRITSNIECSAYDFGFAVRRDDFEAVSFTETRNAEYACCENKYSYCRVDGKVLNGNTVFEGGYVLRANPNTNLLYQRTSIPGAQYLIREGDSVIQSSVEGIWK